MDITSSPKWKELAGKIGSIKDKETYQETLALFFAEFGYENMTETGVIPDFIDTFGLGTLISYTNVREDLLLLEKDGKIPTIAVKKMDKIKSQIPVIDNNETYIKALELLYTLYGETLINVFVKCYELDTLLHISIEDVQTDLKKIKYTREFGTITDRESYKRVLEKCYDKYGFEELDEEWIHDFIDIYKLDTLLHISIEDVQTDLKKINYTREFGTITDKESYKKVLEIYYNKKCSSEIFDKDKIQEFIDMYELDTLLHINVNDVQTDLRKIKYTREFGTITDKESYKKVLEKCYEKYGSEVLDEEWMQKFIDIYELDILLHINVNDVQTDLKKIKYTGRIDAITDIESYRDALELCYGKFKEELFDKEKTQEFIDIYELDTLLHIGFNDVQTDLKKIKYTGEIITITDKESYRKALELYYKEYTGRIFDKDKIQEFIDIYKLDILLHISFSDVCIDLVRLHFENKRIKVITDNYSYLRALELLYFNFDDIIIFDEDFICKFINAYHLDTRFNISPNDVWNDLAKIKRQSELEDKILDEIDTVEDIESYKEALELYYNVFGKDMFEIDKVQEFIDTFDLYDIDITSNTVYRDLRAIERAFGSRDEISQSNFTSLHPDIKPAKTITPSEEEPYTQIQTTNTIQPEEDDHDYLERRDIDKDFGRKVDGHEDFYFFVINMSDTELINTINSQYKNIKGSWILAPHMGEYGSVEFAAVLLLWRYAVTNFVRNPESYGSLQITLGDVICCAFFGMTAGEWSDKVDTILNAHSDIVSYEEFGNVYNYLRNNHIDKIHSLEFNDGNMREEVYRQFYTKFTEIYNSTNGFKEMIDFYTSKGLKIKDDIHFNVANDKNDILKYALLREWKSDWGNLEEDTDIQQLPPLLTDKFYISSYRCPICGRHMYKTVFPIGGEFPIRTTDGYISMKRVFTCKTCLRFFTSLPERKLSCGQYYSLRMDTLNEYKMLLEAFDNHGTTVGRPDA